MPFLAFGTLMRTKDVAPEAGFREGVVGVCSEAEMESLPLSVKSGSAAP